MLLVIAIACRSATTRTSSAETYLYQRTRTASSTRFSRARPGAPARDDAAARPRPRPAQGEMIGRIEIPRLGVSVDRPRGQRRAHAAARGRPHPRHRTARRTATSASPAIATRSSAGCATSRPDDEIRVVTPHGVFTYRVERTDVVQPEDVWVLDPTDDAEPDAGDLLSVHLRRLGAAALHRPRLAPTCPGARSALTSAFCCR